MTDKLNAETQLEGLVCQVIFIPPFDNVDVWCLTFSRLSGFSVLSYVPFHHDLFKSPVLPWPSSWCLTIPRFTDDSFEDMRNISVSNNTVRVSTTLRGMFHACILRLFLTSLCALLMYDDLVPPPPNFCATARCYSGWSTDRLAWRFWAMYTRRGINATSSTLVGPGLGRELFSRTFRVSFTVRGWPLLVFFVLAAPTPSWRCWCCIASTRVYWLPASTCPVLSLWVCFVFCVE